MLVCGACFLVQLPAVVSAESIFGEYAYFSSYSESWLEHARRYVESIVERLGLGPGSFVVEVASNDGYLLQYLQPLGIGVLGVEPARNVAAVARERGIPTVEEFLGRDVGERLAGEHGRADLVVGQQRARARSRSARLHRAASARSSPTTACSRSSSRTCCD